MSFWAGFLAGAAALWALATTIALVLAWYLHRASRVPDTSEFVYWDVDNYPYPEQPANFGTFTVPFSHVTNFGEQVKGDG